MTNFEFPLTLFPVCRTGETDRDLKYPKGGYSFDQRFNAVEYGKFSAAIWSLDAEVHFRNHGNKGNVHYDTSCTPLLPPNTATPFDHTPDQKDYDEYEMKYRVDRNFRYFKHSFFRTYVPMSTLVQSIVDEQTLDKDTQEFEPSQGSVISYVSSWSEDNEIAGYIIYGSGPNLNELTISVVTNNFLKVVEKDKKQDDSKSSTYLSYASQYSHLGLPYAEVLALPGRIRQVTSINIENRILVAVRCNYHIAFFKGPSPIVEQHLIKDPSFNGFMSESPLNLLTTLSVYNTSVMTSCVCLCPYMYGEAVFITESGGLYLWDNDSGVTKIQSPITSTNPSEVCHYFQCVYGPHPRCVILAEHRCVSTVEFIEENLAYKNILKQGSPYLLHCVVSSISRHPLHPFYLFIATEEKLLLFDLRQTNEALLEIRHELVKPIRYMDVICCPWQLETTLVMMSSLQDSKCHVHLIKGGYTVDKDLVSSPPPPSVDLTSQGGCTVDKDLVSSPPPPPPPSVGLTPHAVDSYSALLSHLNLPSPIIHWRMTRPISGGCLIPLISTKQFCGLLVSQLGDIFYQIWHYGVQPTSSPVVPYPSVGCGLWIEEILKQEKLSNSLSETNNKQLSDISWNNEVIMNYILSPLSDQRLCLRCVTLLKEEGPYKDVPIPDSDKPHTCDGTTNVWTCSMCHETIFTSIENSKYHQIDQEEQRSGLDILHDIAGSEGQCPSDYDEIQRLWKLWDENQEEEDNDDNPPLSQSQTFSQSQNQSQTLGLSQNQSQTPSLSQTLGLSQNQSQTPSLSQTLGRSQNQSQTPSLSQSLGLSQNQSQTPSLSQSLTDSQSSQSRRKETRKVGF